MNGHHSLTITQLNEDEGQVLVCSRTLRCAGDLAGNPTVTQGRRKKKWIRINRAENKYCHILPLDREHILFLLESLPSYLQGPFSSEVQASLPTPPYRPHSTGAITFALLTWASNSMM